MSLSAANATIFYKEVASNKLVWAIRDNKGFPAPENNDGVRSMPFWSSMERAHSIIKLCDEYKHFEPVQISWDTFVERWLPGLENDRILAGLNWAGINATGYDVRPEELKSNVEYYETRT